jgi:hypothetical protein
MAVEFEFLAMRGHRRHNGFRGRLSAFGGSRRPECSARLRPNTCAKAATVGGP